MKNNPLFQNLNEEEYEKFIAIFTKKIIQKNNTILKEGELNDTAFLLLAGKVSASKESIYGDDYVLTSIKAGGEEFFGEINLIDKGKNTSTIKSIEDCEILSVTSDELKNFMDKNPIIGYKIMTYLSNSLTKHLRQADKDAITLFNALVEIVEND